MKVENVNGEREIPMKRHEMLAAGNVNGERGKLLKLHFMLKAGPVNGKPGKVRGSIRGVFSCGSEAPATLAEISRVIILLC